MPTSRPPDADLDALGKIARSAQRLAVVRFLRSRTDAHLGAIQEGTGIAGPSLAPHLRELEAAGIITGDLTAEERRGRSVRYHLNHQRLQQLVDHLNTQLLG
ncbi:hypothetical protein [Aquipuribacter hungaricus]|uniref:ArsR/SmtB family transcription factor n=1 Tax=Aquipuribacter hungaricus TaxID=545624 RepID=UPI0030EE73DF